MSRAKTAGQSWLAGCLAAVRRDVPPEVFAGDPALGQRGAWLLGWLVGGLVGWLGGWLLA